MEFGRKQMSRTTAQLITESLEAHDVDQIFCVPGESYVGLTTALASRNTIRLIVCRHESGAGFMAAADGRLRPRAGVAVVSRGPGLSNGMVALHSAYHDGTPMVMLIGQVERAEYGRQALQEQNYARLLPDVTKSVIEVNEPQQASEAIARAFHLAESGTPGPVAVILPEDIFDEETEAPLDNPRPRALAAPRAEDLSRLAELLAGAARPLVLVGGALISDSLVDPDAPDDLRRLAQSWMLPVCPTHRRPQLFDTRHPNHGGYMGIRVPPALLGEMQKADLMVALGERLTDTVSQGYRFPRAPSPQLPLVHVWPDANEIGRVWRPELGLACGPHEVIKALLARSTPAGVEARRGWVERLHALHRGLMEPRWEPAPDGINFAAVVCEANRHLAADAAITSDAGNFGSFIHRYLDFAPGQIFLSSVVGAMGSGVPMAVAAALRYPERQVVAFVGDGGALMTGNELATARQYGCNPIMIISDNQMYGTIGMHTHMRYPDRPFMDATRLTNPDFAAWGRAFGAEGITIRSESEVAERVAQAFAAKTHPVVLHCMTSALQMSAWRRYDRGDRLP
jgi:thiamine pyrophosphate-dependent acetolactate synthase large subunit-like protein